MLLSLVEDCQVFIPFIETNQSRISVYEQSNGWLVRVGAFFLQSWSSSGSQICRRESVEFIESSFNFFYFYQTKRQEETLNNKEITSFVLLNYAGAQLCTSARHTFLWMAGTNIKTRRAPFSYPSKHSDGQGTDGHWKTENDFPLPGPPLPSSVEPGLDLPLRINSLYVRGNVWTRDKFKILSWGYLGRLPT